jgi:oligopeptidase B
MPMLLAAETAPVPPVAPRLEHKEVRHGTIVNDDYFWLREKENPRVIN